LYAVDDGDLSVLVLLDLSAAFDTVDHDILLTRLKVFFGIGGAALDWLQSYLTSRLECVRRGSARSTHKTVLFGVPQESVLGPLLFILYTAGLIDRIEGYGLNPHLYADDTQIQGSCRPGSANQLQSTLSVCLDEVSDWMRVVSDPYSIPTNVRQYFQHGRLCRVMCPICRLQVWQKVCRRQVAVELPENNTLEKLGHHR